MDVRLRVRPAQTDALIGVHLQGDDGQAVTVALDAGGRWYTYRGGEQVDIGAYTARRWYDLRIVARPGLDTASVYINGRRAAADLPFRVAVDSLSRLDISISKSTRGSAWVDDVRIDNEKTLAAWPYIGTVRPRDALQVTGSSISVGTETLDRDFASYDAYAEYLGRLGAKANRMQTGWAKTETVAGRYDFGWLRAQVDDARARGLRPWFNVSYGNPAVYGATEGGQIGSGARLPTGNGLQAWGRYVDALVAEFSADVTEWEIWNEPDLFSRVTPQQYANFLIFTASRIRAAQTGARIYTGGIATLRVEPEKFGNTRYAEQVLAEVKAQGKLGLVTAVTYHHYAANPDTGYGSVDAFRTTLAGTYGSIPVRMGEGGAPSRQGGFGALAELNWTETKQAKWDLRRMLNDLGRGIPTSVFAISDMRYGDGTSQINDKGLLRINDATREIRYAKPAYYAIQSVTAVFDNSLKPITAYAQGANTGVVIQGFSNASSGRQAVAVWESGDQGTPPSETQIPTTRTLSFPNGDFTDPVLVDLRTGDVLDIPSTTWSRTGSTYTFTSVPVYDSPILIIDRSLVQV